MKSYLAFQKDLLFCPQLLTFEIISKNDFSATSIIALLELVILLPLKLSLVRFTRSNFEVFV